MNLRCLQAEQHPQRGLTHPFGVAHRGTWPLLFLEIHSTPDVLIQTLVFENKKF